MDYKIILSIFLVVITAVFLLNRQSSIQSELSKFGASINADDFRLINVSSSQNSTVILAQKSNEFIRIRVFPAANTEKRNETFSAIASLFRPVFMVSSYGVPVQTVIVPPAEVFPTNGTLRINENDEFYYLLYADENLDYEVRPHQRYHRGRG
jgi:hypothetical protein